MSQTDNEYRISEKNTNNVEIFNCSQDTPSDQEYAEKLSALRQAISDVPGLLTPLDDEFLGRFLRTKKFDVENSLTLFLQYWKNKQLSDDLSKINFSHVIPFYNEKLIVVLPHRHNGAQILYVRISLWNPSIMTIEEYIMSAFFLLEEVTSSPLTQTHGLIIIVDSKHLSLRQIGGILKQLSVKKIQILVSLFQGGYPGRFNGVHVVNSQYFWNIILGMINPFLKEKLRKRIHVHGKDFTNLYKALSPSILPETLGGQLKNFEDTSLINSLLRKERYYNDLGNFGFKEGKE